MTVSRACAPASRRHSGLCSLLNSTGDKDVTTDILNKQLEGVKLSLDCAVADFLSPSQLVISLKGGELCVLSLVLDSMRSVKGFQCTDHVCQPAIPRVLVPVEQAWQLSPDQVHQQGGEAGQEGGEGATQQGEDKITAFTLEVRNSFSFL